MHLGKVYKGDELNGFVFTRRGGLRLRWWLAVVPGLYAFWNLVVVGMIIFGGSSMTLEPGWHSLASMIIRGLRALG